MCRAAGALIVFTAVALSCTAPLAAQTIAADVPRVVSAAGSRPDGSAGLGDRLTIRVRNYGNLVAQTKGDCRNVVLFLWDAPVPDSPPVTCDPKAGELVFLLDREPQDDANNQAWHRLLGNPGGELRRMSVSLGTPGLSVIPTDVSAFPLFVESRVDLASYFTLLAVFLAVVVVLCWRTNIIRRPGASAYSLSRAQMMFWSVLLLAGYVFLWMITGETDTLTGSAQALAGISAGTAVVGWMIDESRSSAAMASRGFIADILSDDNGDITIHRFQLAVWHMLLGAIFCVTTYRTLFLPQFHEPSLAILGITSAAYIGFKFTAKKPAGASAAA